MWLVNGLCNSRSFIKTSLGLSTGITNPVSKQMFEIILSHRKQEYNANYVDNNPADIPMLGKTIIVLLSPRAMAHAGLYVQGGTQ